MENCGGQLIEIMVLAPDELGQGQSDSRPEVS